MANEAAARARSIAALSEAGLSPDTAFLRRLDAHFPALFAEFAAVYDGHPAFDDELAAAMVAAARAHAERPPEMRALDMRREAEPAWFQSNAMLGGVAYVDRYAGSLEGIRQQIPYFRELGLTYLHLMPLFRCPAENSDGGYAVSSYREVDARLGTMAELKDLATALREAGISLVIDFIFNHTSNEHDWARRALAGERDYEDFYWIFPDRTMPDRFEEITREIFPDDHAGSFVQLPDGRWIWSTFYHFQWDLNYSNPAVFRAMAGEMLFLANQGIEFLRMDAVAFIWKRLGTTCESLPEAHRLIRAFNAVCRIAAPALLFKSEAIVHPDEVVSYIDPAECPISYNPLLMALSWEALATRDARLLQQAVDRRQRIAPGCAWVNYVRSHDDIGWTFADEDAAELGIDGFAHRRFLNAFYVNRFPGSFARGLSFQDNPKTGDCRIAGTTASLAGVEAKDPGGVERVLLLYSIALSAGGVPLLYLGDEVGQLNDYGFRDRPAEAGDSRWVHRPHRPDALYAERGDPETNAGRIFAGLKRLIAVRKNAPALAGGAIHGFWTGNDRVLGYLRPEAGGLLVLANLDDDPQTVAAARFEALPHAVVDLVSGDGVGLREDLVLPPHGFVWLDLSAELA
ncbi:amylosucrase [Antarcticirhabdus aurantiaca]|uniref:Amylosucrase n=1 Tax=Antarcticirhabdus aurantiaca TaxID=2606717 RepID=A0ACD4NLL9_9HYPH|nr:amylosucrase [Antarcticirhabdus aurantiaca]WAJ27701.1 amylosucrase [Jeongeuplla avenae]